MAALEFAEYIHARDAITEQRPTCLGITSKHCPGLGLYKYRKT